MAIAGEMEDRRFGQYTQNRFNTDSCARIDRSVDLVREVYDCSRWHDTLDEPDFVRSIGQRAPLEGLRSISEQHSCSYAFDLR